jgi:hypothetical protein
MTAESQQPTGQGPSAPEPLPHPADRQGSAGQGKPGSLQAATDSVGRQNRLDSTSARIWSGPGSDGGSQVEYKALKAAARSTLASSQGAADQPGGDDDRTAGAELAGAAVLGPGTEPNGPAAAGFGRWSRILVTIGPGWSAGRWARWDK